ncbi:MAG: hypothetical protein ABI439_06935 [Rhodospirillales bacterium]
MSASIALGAAVLLAGVAAAQSISVDKSIYGADETIRISYSTPSSCLFCELHIINLSDNLRYSSFDAWIRDAFYKPGGVSKKPVFYSYSEERVRLEAGRTGTFEYSSNLLKGNQDKSRGWFRVLLIRETTEILAQAPFMVIKRRGPPPSVLQLENELGASAGSFIGAQRLVARLAKAPASPDAIKSDLWRLGADTSLRSWTLTPNSSVQALQLDGFRAGSYEMRFLNRQPGLVLGAGAFEVTYPYSATALSFVPARADPYAANQLPKLAIAYAGRSFVLALFRVAGARLERLWGWETGNTTQFNLKDRLPAELRTLPPGLYEFRLYVPNNERDGDYLVSRLRLAIAGDVAPAVPLVAAGQISLAGGKPVLIGDNFDISFTVPPGDGPTWLALYPKPYFAASCTILEAAAPLAVKEGVAGNAHFRYPVPVSGSGTATLLAPWTPGEYELRLYRGALPDDTSSLTYPKATLLAALPLTIGLAEPLFTMRPSIGAVVELGTAIEVDVQPSDKLRRDLFKSWLVYVTIVRASEVLPGGGVMPAASAGVTIENRGAPGGKVRFASIDLDPGPYEVLVSATASDGPPLRFVARHRFDVPPPGVPAMPADAAFIRIDGFAARDGYAPQIPHPEDCARGSLASLLGQPLTVATTDNKPRSRPKLTITEWFGGDPDTDNDDRYVAVSQMFPGFPYVVEARFTEAQSAESYTVAGPGNAAIVVKRTADPLVYRSQQIVFVPGATP